MNKMLRNIIILAAVVAVSVLALVFVPKLAPESQSYATAEPTATPDPNLIVNDFDYEQVEKVTLEYDGAQTTIVYDATEDRYYVQGYEDVNIDSVSAKSVFSYSATVEALSLAAESLEDVEQYGLNDPNAKITLEFYDGTTSVLLFGAYVPGTGQYYMIKEGVEKVFVVYNTYGNNAKLTLEDLVELDSAQIESERIKHIAITVDGEPYAEFDNLDADEILDMTTWKMVYPYYRSVEMDSEESPFYILLESVSAIEPYSVLSVDGSLQEYGLDNPWVTISILYDDDTETTYIISHEQDNYLAMKYADSDTIYKLSSSDIVFLDYEPFDYTMRLLSLIGVTNVNEVRMSGVVGDNVLVIENSEKVDDEGNVSLDANGDPAIETNFVVNGEMLSEDDKTQGSWFYQSLLYPKVTNLADDEFVPEKSVGSIEFVLEKDGSIFAIDFYEYNEYFYAVTFSDSNVIMTVNKKDIDVIPGYFEDLKAREMERPY